MVVRDDDLHPGVPDGKELGLKAGRGDLDGDVAGREPDMQMR